VSDTMLMQAAKRYRRDVAAGRLALHNGSLTRLPFADGTLTGVVTVNTIYFVAELQLPPSRSVNLPPHDALAR
jgi:arsenite methyltransferase